jgi:hypothetical protein
MWFFLSFVPDWFVEYFVHIIFGVGFSGLITGIFLSKIPFVDQYGFLIKTISTVFLVIGIFLEGGLTTEMAWRSKVAEMETKIKVAEEKSKKVNAKIEKEVNERVKIIKDKNYANRKEIESNRNTINAECKLSDSAWMFYNRTTQNAMANGTTKSNGTSK